MKTELWAVSLCVALMFGWCALPGSAKAANGLQPQGGDVEVHDFAFQDGERLPLLRLDYTALGTPITAAIIAAVQQLTDEDPDY